MSNPNQNFIINCDRVSKIMILDKRSVNLSTFLEQANQRGAWIVKLFVQTFAIICPIGILIECLMSAVYSQYKYGYINPNALFYPYKFMYEIIFSSKFRIRIELFFLFRLPWNQQSVLGWCFEVIFSFIASPCPLFITPIFATFFNSIREYNRAFYEMFHAQVNQIDEIIAKKPQRLDVIKGAINKTISFHVSAKG